MEQQPSPENQNQPSSEQSFVTRPVEQPMFTSDVREKLANQPVSLTKSENTFIAFYKANKYYFWGFGVGIIAIFLLTLIFLHKSAPTQTAEAKINIVVSAPDKVASGADEVYNIEVDNQDSQKLTGMQLELVYDDGVSYQSSSPGAINLSGTTFSIPDLAPGQNAVVIVKTKVTGNVGDTKDLDVKLHYQIGGLTSQFLKEQHSSVQVIASDISIDLSGPTTANNGQNITYEIDYLNNSDHDAQNSRITVTYPQGFTFAQASPQPDLSNNTWSIGTLAKGAGGKITISGAFNSVNPGESITAVAQFLILGSNGNYVTQSSSQPVITSIASQPLLVSQLINNNSQNIIDPGDNLTFTIKYQNNASVAANSVNIAVTLDSQALDLSTIQAQGGNINNNTITWNAASVSQLAVLAPNESGTLEFSVRVKNPATKDSSTNLAVVSHVKIKSDEYTDFFPGNDISLKISSPSSLASSLSYISGSLPPKVGTNTTYKVTFLLKNSTNIFTNGILTAFIPLGAGGFNQNSVSDPANVTYDPSSGKLTWNVGQLGAHTGQFVQAKDLEFTINLNPATSQANQSPILVKGIVFNAIDSFTQQNITDKINDITTSSVQGNGYNNGQVQP